MQAKIIGKLELIDSKITSKGDNNVVFVDPACPELTLQSCSIVFEGNNNLLYLCSSGRPLMFRATLQNDSIVYFGKNVSCHKKADLHILASERKHVFIGNDVLFSTNIWIRTTDAHAIYSVKDGKRVNPGKSVIIGDHVWVGQNAMVLKGTTIGSGSIIAAGAVTPNKVLFSNSIYGGVPAKLIGAEGDYFFEKETVNGVTEDTNFESANIEKFTYKNDLKNKEFQEKLEQFLAKTHEINESIEFFKVLPNYKDRLCFHSENFHK